MYISKVSLVNYRNFANAKVVLKEGINTIIGENGSGKTNLFRAIRLLLEDSSIQYAYKLNEHDFNRTLGDRWKGHWIIISLEFSDLSHDEAIQSLFLHGAGEIEGDFVEKATYTLFFRPKADIRRKLSELTEGDKEGLEEILNNISIEENYETFFTGKSTADFNDPDVYKKLVGDFDMVRFPKQIDSSEFGAKIPHQLSVSKEVSFTFVKALRDVVSDFHNNRTNPLLTLLKNRSGEIDESVYTPISGMVDKLNKNIEQLEDVQMIRKDIKKTIQDAVGLTYSPASLSIRSSVPSEAEKLLQSLKIFIGESDENHEGGVHELSLGGANLIFLTLKLLEFKYRKSRDTFANFLIIEEPEAHIHNHIQKALFDKLDYGDTQIIYSTHSTQISEVSNVENMNILAKKTNYAEVYQPATGLNEDAIIEVQRYLDAVRTNLLFAKGVVLVEGDAEEILIPIMIKEILGLSLDELGISLINIRSTGFNNVAQLFHDTRIQRRCSIVTDLDDAMIPIDIEEGDSDDVKKAKEKAENSMVSGLQRKQKLDELTKENSWLNAFYANYTFEVDFVHNDNSWEVEQIIEEVYKDQKTIEKAREELDSDDVAVFGKRVLTMANNEGKGWFAIKLGNHIHHNTYIPEYILDAIIFAKESFSKDVVFDIIKYRCETNLESEAINEAEFSTCTEKAEQYYLEKISLSGLISELKEVIPDDQLITLLEKLQ